MKTLHRSFYFLNERNQEIGPFAESELKGLKKSGLIKSQTLVWAEGYENWIPYSDAFPAEPMFRCSQILLLMNTAIKAVRHIAAAIKKRLFAILPAPFRETKVLLLAVMGFLFFLLYPLIILVIANRSTYSDWQPPTAAEIMRETETRAAQKEAERRAWEEFVERDKKTKIALSSTKVSPQPSSAEPQIISASQADGKNIRSRKEQKCASEQDTSKQANVNNEVAAPVTCKDKAQEQLSKLGIPIVDYEKRLLEFAQRGNLEYVRLLIQAGARVNTNEIVNREEGRFRATPLSEAAYNGHTQCVEELLKSAEIDVKKGAPIYSAAVKKHTDCLKLILQKGGDVNEVGLNGETALTIAAAAGDLECVKLLAQTESIQPNLFNKEKKSALYLAVQNKHADCAKVLLGVRNIDINSTNGKNSMTPLHEAVKEGDKEMVILLLQQPNININATNGDGNTPVQLAMIYERTSVCKALFYAPDVDLGEDYEYYGCSNDYLTMELFLAREKQKKKKR